MTRRQRIRLPLWLLRILRDRQARKVLSPEQIKAAEIKHRMEVAARKVRDVQMASTSNMPMPKLGRPL